MSVEFFCGASDARHFEDHNIPSLQMNPSGDNIHGDGEFVIISSLYKLEEIYKNFLLRLEGKL